MASLVWVVHLTNIAGLALNSAEGLLLQKHVPQLLDGGEQRYLDAYPHFSKSAELYGDRPEAGDVYFETGSSTSSLEKNHTVDRGDPDKMYLRGDRTRVAMGVLSQSTTLKSDIFNFVPIAMRALSDSTGMVVSQAREHEYAVPTATLRLFRDGLRTHRTCSSSKPPLLARCGDHYLFPGYTVKLVKNEGLTAKEAEKCLWRFRQISAEVIVTLKGVEPKHDIYVSFEEVDVATSLLVTFPRGERVNKKERPSHFRDLLISLPKYAEEKGISVEVCVPASDFETIKEYKTTDWRCCGENRYLDCGIPEGTLQDKDFGMNTMPWQALITVTVEYESPSGDTKYATTYCSGSLIFDEWVLTTASCLLRPELDHPGSIPSLFVTFGSGYDSEKIKAAEFIAYPAVTEDHDVALIRLSRRTKRRRVCLPGFDIRSGRANRGLIGQKGTVFGWVVESEDVHYMTTLNQTILDSDECSSRLGRRLAPHILCTEDHTKGNPCLADGNLLYDGETSGRFVLRGLVTPRLHCNDDYRPHSSVEFFMPWIANVTDTDMPAS